MNILHIASINDDKSSGPNINVPKNVIYGNEIANVGLYNLRDSKLIMEIPKEKNFCRKKFKHISELPAPFNCPDIVIFHGVYYIEYCHIAKWLRKNNIPYIIVPRCSMTTAAIKSHFLKKWIANLLFFSKFVAGANAVQFLTKNEYFESKRNFKIKDYFVLGNGVELPKKHYVIKKRREFKILFIGRYDVYHKGLDVLLEAIEMDVDWFRKNNVTVELCGSDIDDGLAFLKKNVSDKYLKDIVHILGPVFNKDKEDALLDADVFIHTSRLEGQPTSVIEAISYGIPVIVTPGTNVLDIVKKNGLGFASELDPRALFDSIKKAFSERNNFPIISKREIIYAEKNFDWRIILKKGMDIYSNILRGGK